MDIDTIVCGRLPRSQVTWKCDIHQSYPKVRVCFVVVSAFRMQSNFKVRDLWNLSQSARAFCSKLDVSYAVYLLSSERRLFMWYKLNMNLLFHCLDLLLRLWSKLTSKLACILYRRLRLDAVHSFFSESGDSYPVNAWVLVDMFIFYMGFLSWLFLSCGQYMCISGKYIWICLLLIMRLLRICFVLNSFSSCV